MIRYLFNLDASGKPISGIKLEYDDTPITRTVQVPVTDENGDPVLDGEGNPTYEEQTITEPAPIPAYPAEYTTEGIEEVWLNQHRATFSDDAWVLGPEPDPLPPQPIPETLEQKAARLEAENVALRQRDSEMQDTQNFIMETLVDKGIIV